MSVVLAIYNGEQYLREALESLLVQTFESFEILVIDDGSTDGTRGILEDVAARDLRVRLHHQKHAGVVNAFNFAARHAQGEYLAWLGADDVAVPQRLEHQVRFMDAHPRVAVLGGMIVATDPTLRPILPIHYPTDDRHIRESLLDGNAVAAPAAMIRTSVYNAVGGCRSAFNQGAEDYDLWLRIAETHELANLPELLVYYRIHPAQVTRTRSEQLMVAIVGAQLSARTRRTGGIDPFDCLEQVTYDTLLASGPSKDTVDTALVDAAAGHATFLVLMGAHTDALIFLEWAAEISKVSRVGRRARSRALIARSLAAWNSTRRFAALRPAISAAVLDPRLAAHLVARGIHALIIDRLVEVQQSLLEALLEALGVRHPIAR